MKTEKDFYPGWQMTPDQRNKYFNEMGACARKLGRPLEETRKRVHIWAFKEPRSAKLINHRTDYDELKKVWAAIQRGDDLDAQLALHDQPNKRLIHLIRVDYRAALSILLPINRGDITAAEVMTAALDRSGHPTQGKAPNFYRADRYMATVLEDRFKGKTIDELDTVQRPMRGGGTKSELEMYRDTLARCISQARQKTGFTGHDLNIIAGLNCTCADCRKDIPPAIHSLMQPHHIAELATADIDEPAIESNADPVLVGAPTEDQNPF